METVIALNSPYRQFELPWTLSAEQERRFRRITWWVLGVVVVFSILVPWLPVPEPEELPLEEEPPRLVKWVIEPVVVPPPPVEQPKPVEPPKPIQRKPEPKVIPKPTPAPPKPDARERAAAALQIADELAALRDSSVVDDVTQRSADLSAAPGEGPTVERSLITSKAGKSSAGINTASLSRGTGGGGLAGRSTTSVGSPGGTGSGAGAAGSGAGDGAGSGLGSRSREEIERVFDQNKGSIYTLYNRALRQNAGLQGQLVLRLTIQPNGTVTDCVVVSSELNDPELESRLVARVKLFKFEDKDVAPITTTKPIDFFPA